MPSSRKSAAFPTVELEVAAPGLGRWPTPTRATAGRLWLIVQSKRFDERMSES